MDKEYIRQILPEKPRPGMLQWILANCDDELGDQYLVWRAEKVPIYPDPVELMTPAKWKPKRYERMAKCTCLACGAEFYTELNGSTLTFWFDEWPIDPFRIPPWAEAEDPEDAVENGYDADINDGDNITCPMCERDVRVLHAQKLRGGRRKQVLVSSVETVGNYAAVVYWLVWRDIFDDGNDYGVFPRDAYVLNERGTLVHYAHTKGGGTYCAETDAGFWRLASSCVDTIEKPYHDWGSICNRKAGGISYPEIPDLTDTTGEKTGLAEYSRQATCLWAVSYLRLWRKYRKIENLVNTGWVNLVDDVVSMFRRSVDVERDTQSILDLKAVKPFKMLHMTRSDFRQLRNTGGQWNLEMQRIYMQCQEAGMDSVVTFRKQINDFGTQGVRTVCELQRIYGDAPFDKVARYMKKQNMQPREAGLLLDTRNMARDIAGRRQLTTEELWPRNLASTHERLTRLRVARIDKKTANVYQAGFDRIVDTYRELEWNDGELCVLLPRCNAELVREGLVLRHCVGTYGQDHINGHHVIFFIRHYRRPERCYYTLDICMDKRPYRNQLHGYGNEHHGIHKEYRHKIPQKVLDFCARWEREVLMPWYEGQQRNKGKEDKTA